MPDEIENLFSLMDFAHNGKISEQEFLAATGHYRRLGQLLTIDRWEKFRTEMVTALQRDVNLWRERKREKEKKRGAKKIDKRMRWERRRDEKEQEEKGREEKEKSEQEKEEDMDKHEEWLIFLPRSKGLPINFQPSPLRCPLRRGEQPSLLFLLCSFCP